MWFRVARVSGAVRKAPLCAIIKVLILVYKESVHERDTDANVRRDPDPSLCERVVCVAGSLNSDSLLA